MTACGLPIETAVTATVRSARTSGALITGPSPAPSVVGTSAGISTGSPMSTRTLPTLPFVADLRLHMQQAGARLDGQIRLAMREAPVVDILGEAADAVAAHLRFGAVRVEHPHPKRRGLARQDQDHAVRADAELAVAQERRPALRLLGQRLAFFAQAVDHDEVVADAVHFGEIAYQLSLRDGFHLRRFRRRARRAPASGPARSRSRPGAPRRPGPAAAPSDWPARVRMTRPRASLRCTGSGWAASGRCW